MKIKKRLSIFLLTVFVLTTFQSEIKVLADTVELVANRIRYVANDKTLKEKD